MSESETARSSTKHATITKFIVLAAILSLTAWLGLRALQATRAADAPPPGTGPPPPINVRVAAVRMIPARETHRLTGSLRARSRAELAAREEGAVAEVLIDESDHVSAGDVLVRLDPRRLEARIAEAQASVTAAESLVAQREAEFARTGTDLAMKRRLADQQAISRSEFLDAERESKVSESLGNAAEDQLAAALAAVQLLEVRREDLVLTSPFDARVVARHIEPGEWVRPGDPAFTLVSNGSLEVWLQAPERHAATLAALPLQVTIGGNTLTAVNPRVIPEADPASRVVTIIAEVPDPDGSLVPGLSATAEVPVSAEIASPVVPSDAVVTTYAGPAVFRIKQTSPPIAERIPVEVRFQRDNQVFLVPGPLEAGDLVIVEGNERLLPDTPVAFDPPTPEDTAQTR